MHYYQTLFFSIKGILCLIFSLISGLTYNISILIFANITINVANYLAIFTFAIFHVLSGLNQLLTKNNMKIWYMRKFMSIHTEELTTILKVNRINSIIFLAFIVLNVPINLYTVVGFMLNIYNKVSLIFLTNIVIYQYNAIFGFHLFASIYTERIHRCSRRLTHLYVNDWPHSQYKGTKMIDSYVTINRLKLSNYIEKFHTEKRYGFTYGPFGLITYKTFAKVCNIYFKTFAK